MIRRFVMTTLVVSLMAASLPLAQAQFADDTQGLFTGDPDAPRTQNDIMTFDLGNPEDDEPINTSGAQSVEELCCALSEEERKTDGLCVEVECEAAK